MRFGLTNPVIEQIVAVLKASHLVDEAILYGYAQKMLTNLVLT